MWPEMKGVIGGVLSMDTIVDRIAVWGAYLAVGSVRMFLPTLVGIG